MGTWNTWHFVAFVGIAAIGYLTARSAHAKASTKVAGETTGYAGWLVVFSIFLLFWATQELSEFYRVRTQIELLVPSAPHDLKYLEYIGYALAMAWIEALLLVACICLIVGIRAGWAIKAIIPLLWIAGPLAAAGEFALADFYFGQYLVDHDYSAILATTLFAATWTVYLLRSKRVKNTYRGNDRESTVVTPHERP